MGGRPASGELDAPGGERSIRVLHEIELLVGLREELADLRAAEEEQAAQWMDTGSITTLTRDSSGLCPW